MFCIEIRTCHLCADQLAYYQLVIIQREASAVAVASAFASDSIFCNIEIQRGNSICRQPLLL